MFNLLRFPAALRQFRTQRGLMQKTVAYELRLDPALLCAAERGTRGPLDGETLAKAAELLQLSAVEFQELSWAAHHDRILGFVRNKGASSIEMKGISAMLLALHHLQADQRDGLIQYCDQVVQSARLVYGLSSPRNRVEGIA